MRIKILTESTTLNESPFDIKAQFVIHSKENSLNSDFNPDISREYIKSLNVDKVADAVSASRPYITTFFKAVFDR